jgi:hypothetical protein
LKGIKDLKPEQINITWIDQNERDNFLKFLDNGSNNFFSNGEKNGEGFYQVEKNFYFLIGGKKTPTRSSFGNWAFNTSVKNTEVLKLGDIALKKYLAYILYFRYSSLYYESNQKLDYSFADPNQFLNIILGQHDEKTTHNTNSPQSLISKLEKKTSKLLKTLNQQLADKTYISWEIISKNGILFFNKEELEGYNEFQEKLKSFDNYDEKPAKKGETTSPEIEEPQISELLLTNSQFTSQPKWHWAINWLLPFKSYIRSNLIIQDERQLYVDLKLYIQPHYITGKAEYINRKHIELKEDEHLDDLLYQLLNTSYEKNLSKDFKYFYIIGQAGVGKTLIIQRILYRYRRRFFGNKKVFLTPYKLLFVERILKEANSADIVLVDSLDESEEYIINPEEALKNLLKLIDKPDKILITCRSSFITKDQIDDVHSSLVDYSAKRRRIFELKEFSKAKVEEYLEKRFKNDKRLKDKALEFFDFLDRKSFDFLARQWFLQHVTDNIETLKINEEGEYKYQVLNAIVRAYVKREVDEKVFQGKEEEISRIYDIVCTNLARERYLNPRRTSFILEELVPEESKNYHWIEVIKRSFLGFSEKGEISFNHQVWYDLWLAKFLFTTELYEIESRWFNEEYWDKICQGKTSEFEVCLDFWKEMVAMHVSKAEELSKYRYRGRRNLRGEDLTKITPDNVLNIEIIDSLRLESLPVKWLKYFKRIEYLYFSNEQSVNGENFGSHGKASSLRFDNVNLIQGKFEGKFKFFTTSNSSFEQNISDQIVDLSDCALIALYKTDIDSLRFLKDCVKLKDLSIVECSINYFQDNLYHLPLRNLELLNNPIKRFDFLKSLTQIEKISVSVDTTSSLNEIKEYALENVAVRIDLSCQSVTDEIFLLLESFYLKLHSVALGSFYFKNSTKALSLLFQDRVLYVNGEFLSGLRSPIDFSDLQELNSIEYIEFPLSQNMKIEWKQIKCLFEEGREIQLSVNQSLLNELDWSKMVIKQCFYHVPDYTTLHKYLPYLETLLTYSLLGMSQIVLSRNKSLSHISYVGHDQGENDITGLDQIEINCLSIITESNLPLDKVLEREVKLTGQPEFKCDSFLTMSFSGNLIQHLINGRIRNLHLVYSIIKDFDLLPSISSIESISIIGMVIDDLNFQMLISKMKNLKFIYFNNLPSKIPIGLKVEVAKGTFRFIQTEDFPKFTQNFESMSYNPLTSNFSSNGLNIFRITV